MTTQTQHSSTRELLTRAINVTIHWPGACPDGISAFTNDIMNNCYGHPLWKAEELIEALIRDQYPDCADEWLRKVGFQLEKPYIPEPGHWFTVKDPSDANPYGPYLAIADSGNELCDAVARAAEEISSLPAQLHVNPETGMIMRWTVYDRDMFTRVNPDGTPWEEGK